MKKDNKIKRYQIIYINYEKAAEELLDKESGGITSLDVLIYVLKVARQRNEIVEFIMPNSKVISMDEAQKMIDKDEFNDRV
jgi:hypothetical protein